MKSVGIVRERECVCMCVRERKRERDEVRGYCERERECVGGGEREIKISVNRHFYA